MSVRICIETAGLPGTTILDVLLALHALDVQQYKRRIVTVSPFHLGWVPDQLVECNDTGCWVNREANLRDAYLLEQRGYGSCGELACAYAAWLDVTKGEGAQIVLSGQGKNLWHVVAEYDGRTYDPQAIGGEMRRRHGT